KLTGSHDFHREVYMQIKEFKFKDLSLNFANHEMENEILVDSYFLNIVRSCRFVCLSRMDNISAEALHQLYQDWKIGVLKLRTIHCFFHVKKETIILFFRLIEINFRNGRFFSNREDIELFVSRSEGRINSLIIFDGLLMMDFIYFYRNAFFDRETGRISWSKHSDREKRWLEELKTKLTKIEIEME
ncbi:hypothetical protein PMAYCL1PPCAC_00556, partial [Pristionchus mayeri]